MSSMIFGDQKEKLLDKLYEMSEEIKSYSDKNQEPPQMLLNQFYSGNVNFLVGEVLSLNLKIKLLEDELRKFKDDTAHSLYYLGTKGGK